MHPNINPESALIQLEQVQRLAGAMTSQLKTLAEWERGLEQFLDEATRPSVAQPTPKFRKVQRGYEYRGKFRAKGSYISICRSLLRDLFSDFPEKRDAIAHAVSRRGYSRRYIATCPEALFQGKTVEWARQHSYCIADGWYLDTNIGLATIRKIVHTAVRAVDLIWDSDVKIFWQPAVERI